MLFEDVLRTWVLPGLAVRERALLCGISRIFFELNVAQVMAYRETFTVYTLSARNQGGFRGSATPPRRSRRRILQSPTFVHNRKPDLQCVVL